MDNGFIFSPTSKYLLQNIHKFKVWQYGLRGKKPGCLLDLKVYVEFASWCDPVESKCFRVEVLSSRKLLGGLEYFSYIAISVNRRVFILG